MISWAETSVTDSGYTVELLQSELTFFDYIAYQPRVRPGQVIVQLDYMSPAIPCLTVLASVSRSWHFSVCRVMRRHNMVDYRRMQLESQRRDLVCYMVHGAGHDRFTLHADLIPEMRLVRIRSPV